MVTCLWLIAATFTAAASSSSEPSASPSSTPAEETDSELLALQLAHPSRLDATLTTTDSKGKALSVGSLVSALWKGSRAFSGHVHRVHADGTADVQFDDGDFEWRLAPHALTKRTSDGVMPVAPDKEDVRPETAAFFATLRRALFLGDARWSALAPNRAPSSLPSASFGASSAVRAQRLAAASWPTRAHGIDLGVENEMLKLIGLPPRNASTASAPPGAVVCPHLYAEAHAQWSARPTQREFPPLDIETLLLPAAGGTGESGSPVVRAMTACADAGHAASQRWLALRMLGRAEYRTATTEQDADSSDARAAWRDAHSLTMRATAMLYFAAVGGDAEASLALAYRHLHGRAVPKSCETSLSYYSAVADGVADEVYRNSHERMPSLLRLAAVARDGRVGRRARQRASSISSNVGVLQAMRYLETQADGGALCKNINLSFLPFYLIELFNWCVCVF